MIRVFIADDHGLVRAGLEQLLNGAEDIEVVGSAAGGREAVEQVAGTRPDVVLMDLSMPDLDGIAATRGVLENRAECQVVVLTSFSDRDRILAALDAGAIGYLLKDAEPDELLRGVRAAARGESPLAPKAARQLIASRTAPAPKDAADRSRARDPRPDRRRNAEQGHRTKARNRREDRQEPHQPDLPDDRRHRPHAGRAVGPEAQFSGGCGIVVNRPLARPWRAA